MWPFGPKAPCSHCGKKVRKPKEPGKYLCPHCGEPGPWATPEQVESWTRAREEQQRAEQARRKARQRYGELLRQIIAGKAGEALVPALKETAPLTGQNPSELQSLAIREFLAFVRTALGDNFLSQEEDDRMVALVPALGLSWDQVLQSDPALSDRLIIASANAGRLPTVAMPRLMTKAGEVVHVEFPASLMKEVTLREWRAGSRGVSVPLGRTGVRFRFGAIRGKSVVVGTELQVADTGVLSITSRRAVFTGARKTLEMQYKKLANLNVFTDGIQFHVTNRQNPSLFTVRSGEVVAAIVTAAQREAE